MRSMLSAALASAALALLVPVVPMAATAGASDPAPAPTARGAVTDALARPALAMRQPGAAVLMSAALAGRRLVAVGERGVIALSDDGGRQWRQAPCPVSVSLTAVRFADERHGVAVGHGGTVLTTDDAGEHWTLRLDGRQLAQAALTAAQASGDAARLKDAQRLVADGPDKPFLDVLVWDAQRLLAVGAYGIAFGSSDGGRSWQPWMDRLPNPQGLHLYVARRAGDALLLAGEQGLLMRSDDGGASFKPLVSPYKGSWFTAEMVSPGELVLAGLRGNAWRSTDAGQSWQAVQAPMPASITASLRTGDGLLFANQAGFVMKLQGAALVPVNARPLPPLAGLAQAPDGALLALGITGPVPVTAGPVPVSAAPAASEAAR